MSKICIWYEISRSNTPEGIIFQEQHQEVPFNICRKYCDGFNSTKYACQHYCLKELNEEEEENLVGRIEDIEFQSIQ